MYVVKKEKYPSSTRYLQEIKVVFDSGGTG
jgi:hypothetical protein